MNMHNKTTAMDKKILLSTIWIFVVLNYLILRRSILDGS